MTRLSIIVPVLNEASGVAAHLDALIPFRLRGAEVIVVDGGSQDDTVEEAEGRAERVIIAGRGRAERMNVGASLARGGALLFLPVGTSLPDEADELIAAALAGGAAWGRFDARRARGGLVAGFGARALNLRSRWSGLAAGCQAIFVARGAFRAVGGCPDLPGLEDLALSALLKRLTPAARPAASVTVWGAYRQRRELGLIAAWRARIAFALGADPRRLAIGGGAALPPRAPADAPERHEA